MREGARVFLAGHTGLVGSALHRRLRRDGTTEVLTRPRAELDLTDQAAVRAFFAAQRPELVLLAAAKVGGILANSTRPADFIRDNLLIQCNVLDAAREHGVERFLFLGSSCIYPRAAPQPIQEGHLLTGPLEPTNEPYAVAKIAGLKMLEAFGRQHGLEGIALMPTNLYGPGDNFDPEASHVVPALIRRFHEATAAGAPTVLVWGTGTPRRELLHVDDLADAAFLLLSLDDPPALVNVGTGQDISIRELAELIAEVVGFEGEIAFDPSKPDGTPRKLLDISRLSALGWSPRIGLREGLVETYRWFREAGP